MLFYVYFLPYLITLPLMPDLSIKVPGFLYFTKVTRYHLIEYYMETFMDKKWGEDFFYMEAADPYITPFERRIIDEQLNRYWNYIIEHPESVKTIADLQKVSVYWFLMDYIPALARCIFCLKAAGLPVRFDFDPLFTEYLLKDPVMFNYLAPFRYSTPWGLRIGLEVYGDLTILSTESFYGASCNLLYSECLSPFLLGVPTVSLIF